MQKQSSDYKLPVSALGDLDALGRQAEQAAQRGVGSHTEALSDVPEPVRATLRAEGAAAAYALAIEVVRQAIREHREAVQG